jgi:outer membrane immunogenic protein
MRKPVRLSIVVVVAGLLAASAAVAADMPVKAPPAVVATVYNWTGLYIGVNAGYGWSHEAINLTGDPVTVGPTFIIPGGVPTSIAKNPKGFIGGAQIGYNYQTGRWLLGFEADFDGAGIRSSQDVTGIVGVPRFTHGEQKLDWLATVRARAGFTPWDRFLVYATGGLAVGHAKSSIILTTTVPNNVAACIAANVGICMSDSQSKTLVGWTAGGGLEFALGGNWSVKAEYLYYDLGNINTAAADTRFAPPQPVLFGDQQVRGNIVRAGLNYRFSAR